MLIKISTSLQAVNTVLGPNQNKTKSYYKKKKITILWPCYFVAGKKLRVFFRAGIRTAK